MQLHAGLKWILFDFIIGANCYRYIALNKSLGILQHRRSRAAGLRAFDLA